MILRSIVVVAAGFVRCNSASAQFLSDPRILPGDIEPAPAVAIARGEVKAPALWSGATNIFQE